MANTRDSETPLWFDDGNVILRSGDTMHRVHRSIVGRHSAKLRRIFEIRKEVNGDYESPPVLFVTDNADNLLHYVRARYNEDRHYFESALQPFRITVHMLAASIEFADYRMRDHVIERVMMEYPTTLANWDRRESRISPTDWMEFDALHALQLHHVYTALPAVFYKICRRFSAEAIFRGMRREDGTVATLSPTNQISCAVGRDRLLAAQMNHTYRWLKDGSLPDHRCITKEECLRQLRCIEIDLKVAMPAITALDKWNSTWDDTLCSLCTEHAKCAMSSGRQEIWRALPEFFELISWGNLADSESLWMAVDIDIEFVRAE